MQEPFLIDHQDMTADISFITLLSKWHSTHNVIRILYEYIMLIYTREKCDLQLFIPSLLLPSRGENIYVVQMAAPCESMFEVEWVTCPTYIFHWPYSLLCMLSNDLQ